MARFLAALALLLLTLAVPARADVGRLSGVSIAGPSSGQWTGFSFTTNAQNFITGQVQTSDAAIAYPPGSLTQTASYNGLNQLTNLSGQALTFDADGNLTSDGTRTYSWDAENRLVGIAYPGQPGKAITFAYDGLGRRVQISSTPAGGGTAMVTGYVWCGARLCQARNAVGAVTKGYAEGEYAPGSPSVSAYYAPDQVGSVRRAFTAESAPSYDNDPYGNALQGTAPVTDFVYAGLFYNADSGLLLATNRVYSPAIGRWLSRDPAGESADPQGNLYAYVGGNPVSGADPSGLWQITIQAGAGVGGIFTFGNNGGNGALNGQWNYGGYIGAGEGLSATIDPSNRGCQQPGVNYGLQGAGEIGVGPEVEAEAHAFGRQPWWNINLGFPGTALGASIGSEGAPVPILGFGESAVAGVGGTAYLSGSSP
ncbi:MAG: RHS repeat-associated core domain-containing protein [Caulobacteraceae bacterium]